MKRILGMVVAIAALLAYSSVASAAPVTFDLSGSAISWSRSTDAAAEFPETAGGICTPGMESPPAPAGAGNNCFRYAFAPGSSVTVDITGSAVTMIGGSYTIDTRLNPTPLLFGSLNLGTFVTSTIAAGATGTLVGDSILWATLAGVTTVGTLTCTGSPIPEIGTNCGAIGIPPAGEGIPVPFEPLFTLISLTNAVTSFNLGEWQLNAAHTAILASTNAVTRVSQTAQLANKNAGVITFGPTGLGNPVPEPGAAALILLGLGALAVRSRKA